MLDQQPTSPPADGAPISDFARLAAALAAFAGESGERMALHVDGASRLVVVLPDGRQMVFAGTEALTQIIGERLPQFADELRMSQVDLGRLLRAYERRLDDHADWAAQQFTLDRQLSDFIPQDGRLNATLPARQGQDDRSFLTPFSSGRIGRLIDHLPPQPGEDPLFRGEDRRIYEGGLVFAGTEGGELSARLYPSDILTLPGTGSALNHLQPQPDDPSRFGVDMRRRESVGGLSFGGARTDDQPAPPQPRAENDSFRMREDGRLGGDLFGNDFVPGSVRDVRLKGAEPPGRLTINDDGTFLYEPPLHFSGSVSFTYSFVDVRTGREVEAVATIAVDPVADPAR